MLHRSTRISRIIKNTNINSYCSVLEYNNYNKFVLEREDGIKVYFSFFDTDHTKNIFRAFETAQALKAEGLVRHVGFSFHDKADVRNRVLTDHPEVEFVHLQFNYADFGDPGIESWRCYQVCEKHGKPVVVMEPVNGGGLAGKPPRLPS